MSIFNSDEKAKVNYEVSVSSVKKLEKGIGFTLHVNGVTIYQMRAYEYKTTEGKEGVAINFPSYKIEKDGKTEFINYCFFPMDKATKNKIISDILNVLSHK